LLEIRSPRYQKGVLGYFRALKDAVREQEDVPIEAYRADLSRYDLVVIGTPVWNGLISAPIRAYLRAHAHEFRNVAFFVTSGGGNVQRAYRQLRRLCIKEPVAVLELKSGDLSRVTIPPSVNTRVESFARMIREASGVEVASERRGVRRLQKGAGR
jgi:hypothetical protein